MMFAVMPSIRNGMKETSTATGMVMTRDEGARHVPQEEQDDEDDGQDDLDERLRDVVDGAADELGAVVDRDDRDAGRQAGLDLLDPLLDAVDDVEGVLALAHDDDAGDHLAGAVEIGDAAPQVRPQHVTWPMSRMRIGVPLSLAETTMLSKSAIDCA